MLTSETQLQAEGNPMTKVRIDKVTVNVSVGRSGEPLEKAAQVLRQLTGQQPIYRTARKTVKDFGIRRGEPIASIVTLRKQAALDFLKKALAAVGNKIPEESIDRNGNFAFGIKEHIEMPGTRYDPDLGIIGMDVCVTMGKPGYRVRCRQRATSNIGRSQRATLEETKSFLRDTLGVEVTTVEIGEAET